jgi:hypothetical protein
MKMMRNIFLILISLIFFNVKSFASVNVQYQGYDGNNLQYAKTILNERLATLSDSNIQTKLTIDFNVSEKFNMLGIEGYSLDVKKGKISISAAKEQGALYGSVAFIEWVMRNTSPYLVDSNQIDIDFYIQPGQAAKFLDNLPNYSVESKPFYNLRGMECANFALGVADLIDTNKADKFVCMYSNQPGGFKTSVYEWKKSCDWLARHKMNFMSNWPYSMGTNWWELAYDLATAKMTQYTPEEIKKAAKIREELLKYASDRGVRPYLMNYVLGAPNPTIIRNYPEFIGPRQRPEWPAAFCMSSPGLKEMFQTQIRAILKTYPSLGGLHLRWWGESFPCTCEKCNKKWAQLIHDYTLTIINTAKETRPDIDIIISGWIRGGGSKELADELPENVIIQTKWGIDWEPTSFPNVPYDRIAEVKQRFLISQCMPGEEFHPVGCAQYIGLQTGIRQYSNDISKFRNLSGFAVVSAEKDYEWITAMNFVSAAHLNWDPFKADANLLTRNFISSKLCLKSENALIVDKISKALDLTQNVWEHYCVDFGGVTQYLDCYRLHELFGLKRVKTLNIDDLNKGLDEMSGYMKSMQEASDLVAEAKKLYNINKSQRSAFLDDIVIQTDILAKYISSRVSMTQAFTYFSSKKYEMAREEFEKMKTLDQQLLDSVMKKPNISDDFEFEGMVEPIHMPIRVNTEQKEIDEMLQKIAELESL